MFHIHNSTDERKRIIPWSSNHARTNHGVNAIKRRKSFFCCFFVFLCVHKQHQQQQKQQREHVSCGIFLHSTFVAHPGKLFLSSVFLSPTHTHAHKAKILFFFSLFLRFFSRLHVLSSPMFVCVHFVSKALLWLRRSYVCATCFIMITICLLKCCFLPLNIAFANLHLLMLNARLTSDESTKSAARLHPSYTLSTLHTRAIDVFEAKDIRIGLCVEPSKKSEMNEKLNADNNKRRMPTRKQSREERFFFFSVTVCSTLFVSRFCFYFNWECDKRFSRFV